MLKSPYLFAVSVLLALLNWTGLAHAQETELGLSFELPPVHAITHKPSVEQPKRSDTQSSEAQFPHAQTIDAQTIDAQTIDAQTIKENVASGPLVYTSAPLPPIEHPASITSTAEATDIALTFAADDVALEASPQPEKLNFLESLLDAETDDTPYASQASAEISFESFDSWHLDDWIFEHGSDSLVARTVGSAEGTRRADGKRTPAYFGHTDPGNGVWNLGTFSYQHAATSPEDADHKQLQRLKRQGLQLETQAKEMGMTLSLKEKLNGLDLANQAPLAALDKGGYIDRLAQARRLSMEEDEAILWARTYAYIDPNTRRWNAPGLGNNVHSISRDQERRISAIAEAMKAYDPQNLQVTALDNLERITLETTAELASGSLSTTHILDTTHASGEASPSLERLEISFELPTAQIEESPAQNSQVQNTFTLAASNLDSSNLESSNLTHLSEDAVTTIAVEPHSSKQGGVPRLEQRTNNIGIDFGATHNITAQIVAVETTGFNQTTARQTAHSAEEKTTENILATQPSPLGETNQHNASQHNNRERSTSRNEDLFSLQSASNLDAGETDINGNTSEVAAANAISAHPTAAEMPANGVTNAALEQPIARLAPSTDSVEKLQSLISGVTADKLTEAARDRLLQPTQEQTLVDRDPDSSSESRLWHIEDKILQNTRKPTSSGDNPSLATDE